MTSIQMAEKELAFSCENVLLYDVPGTVLTTRWEAVLHMYQALAYSSHQQR